MATITCPFLRILSIYLINLVCFLTFPSKLSLFTTTRTTSILLFSIFYVTSSATNREIFPTQHTLKYVERTIENVSIYCSGDVNSTLNKYYSLFFRTVFYTLNSNFMMIEIMNTQRIYVRRYTEGSLQRHWGNIIRKYMYILFI